MSLRQTALLTEAKLHAQRSNARRSTGPRTARGKSRSRWNALRHGQWASGLAWSDDQLRCLGEDPETFHHLRQHLYDTAGADDPLWALQVEDLARLYWRRSRLEFTWNAQAREVARRSMSHENAPVSAAGALLLRQLDAADRAIDRKVRLLLRLRETEERQRRREEELGDAPDGTASDELSQDGAAVAVETSSAEEKDPEVPPEAVAATAEDSNLEERSQNVPDNKGQAEEQGPTSKDPGGRSSDLLNTREKVRRGKRDDSPGYTEAARPDK